MLQYSYTSEALGFIKPFTTWRNEYSCTSDEQNPDSLFIYANINFLPNLPKPKLTKQKYVAQWAQQASSFPQERRR